MLKNIQLFLKQHFPLCIILGIVLLVAYINIVPGTFLSGWDNLHPEFDFLTNLRRALFGVWQEYQGLGVLAGNAHPTETIRILFLWILSTFIPQWSIRYTYHLLFWGIGGVGAYFLSKKFFADSQKSVQKTGIVGPLVAALFYLLNIGTLQNFYAPYEAFTHHFALLPWLVLTLYTFLEKPTKKRALVLGVVHLLASPMYYIPTIFIVTALAHIVVCVIFFLQHLTKKSLVITAASFLIFGIVNLYWLAPFGYFVSQGTGFVTESSINSIFTEEAFLRNQLFGALPTALTMRGFWFSNTDMADSSGAQQMMMGPWLRFTQLLPTQLLLFSFFALSIIGLMGLFVRKNSYRFTLAALFFVCLFALINDNFPTGFIFRYFQETLPLFKQVFRLPFTKFIVMTSLVYSILVGYSVVFLSKYIKNKYVKNIFTISIFCAILFAASPIFYGHFFYEKMRVTIPTEYFTVFSYFQNNNDQGKVAYLPQPTFWGWITYDWGYRGSGFPWYGTPQPILDRAFDVWSLQNEDYYHELSYALYESDAATILKQVLDKYSVSFVWIDGSIISPHKPLLSDAGSIEKRISELPDFEKVLTVGKQTLFHRKNVVSPLSNADASTVEKNTRFSFFDAYYATYGKYIYPYSKEPSSVLPFGDIDSTIYSWKIKNANDGKILFTNTKAQALSFDTVPLLTESTEISLDSDESGHVTVTTVPPLIHAGSEPLFQAARPFFSKESTLEPIEFVASDSLLQPLNQPLQKMQVRKNEELYFFADSAITSIPVSSKLFTSNPTNCDEKKLESYSIFTDKKQSQLSLSGNSTTRPCVYDKLSSLTSDSQLQSTAQLYDILITLKPSPTANLATCITVDGTETCLNGPMQNSTNTSQWVTYKYTLPTLNYPLSSAWIKLELRPTTNEQSIVLIKDVQIRAVHTPTITLPAKRFFPVSQVTKSATQDSEDELHIVLPNSESKKILLKDLAQTARNCYPLGTGKYERAVLQEGTASFVRYSATNASSCESVYLGQEFKQGALITLKTRNISGRPIKVCVRHDPPGDCLREMVLPVTTNAEWKEYPIVISPVSTKNSRLYLEFDNFALGSEKRVNDVEFIQIDPLPVATLLGIQESQDPTAKKPETSIEQKKYEYYYYKTQVKGPSTLTLNQTYRAGWVAFSVQGKKIFPHTQYNGWGNAWDIPEGDWNIVILFWPQLLSFVGYGCVGALFVILSRIK